MVVENGFGDPSNDGGAKDRGLSPVVGFVLLLGLVIVASSFIFLSGVTILDNVDQEMDEQTAEQSMRQVDKDLSTLTFSDRDHATLQLDDSYNLTDGGEMSVTLRNGFGSSCSKEISLGTLEYETKNGNEIGHQAGGVWRKSGSESSVVSKPDIRYYDVETNGETRKSVDLSVTNVSGSIGSGEHTASRSLGNNDDLSCVENEEFGFVSEVEIVVEGTPYHQAWAAFLRDEFDVDELDENDVDYEPDEERVTLTASLDGDRPFADYVNVDPTIYGGLYVSDEDPTEYQHSGEMLVDGYNGRETTYEGAKNSGGVSDDLFLADVNRLKLGNSAGIDGIVVSNGNLKALPHSSVSTVAFYAGSEESPGSTDVTALQMAESFDSAESIDGKIADANSHLTNSSSAEGIDESDDLIEAGLYYEGDDLDLEDVDIDTSEGDVYIGVSDSVTLSNVDVTGDGRVRIYAGGDVTVENGVTVPDDRAEALWVYGPSTAEVEMEDTFQGVVYAPGSDLEIDDDATIYGAVVGGESDVGDDVTVHFDTSLRTDVPLSEEDLTVEYENATTRKAIDVTFVLDRSGSMGRHCTDWRYHPWYGYRCADYHPGNDPDGERVDATRNFVGMLNATYDDRAGAVEFNSGAYRLHDLSSDLDSVNASVQNRIHGGTDMSAGLAEGRKLFDDDSDDPQKIMILLSDGKNDPRNPADRLTREQARAAAAENITIYTIGLGDDTDEALLDYVARQTGGESVSVDDADELDAVFEGIAANVTESREFEFDSTRREQSEDSNEYVVNIAEWNVEVDEN